MAAAGGDPTHLTYHPGLDCARGWSPDGRRVIIASTRDVVPVPIVSPYFRLGSIASEGGTASFKLSGPPEPLLPTRELQS